VKYLGDIISLNRKGEETMSEGLAWPFNLAEYAALCPEGHHVELSNGYTVFAPKWWLQQGRCEVCRRNVERMVGVPRGEFLAGPVHWLGEQTEEEKVWHHDVFNEHNCPRCRQLGAHELAQILRMAIATGERTGRLSDILEKY
jgi:hypothetical protein